MYKLLAFGIATMILFGAIYAKGRADGAHKWKPIAQAAQAQSAANFKTAMAWKASTNGCEKNRGQETESARTAISETTRQCSERITQVRASDRAMQKAFGKPVQVDKAGCPVRAMFDPKPVLQPEER